MRCLCRKCEERPRRSAPLCCVSSWTLVVDPDPGAYGRPAIEPFRIGHRQVHASMASDFAKVVMPIGAVEIESAIPEEHVPRNAWRIPAFAIDAGGHRDRNVFGENLECAGRRRETRLAGADQRR